MRRQYPEQEQPIFKWTLMSNGAIKKTLPITNYEVGVRGGSARYHMRMPGSQTINSVREEKFDCFKNNTLYSLNGDDARAYKIIRDALEAKVHMYKKEYDKALGDLQKFDLANFDHTERH